jgi:small subunit ribosomal protein S1
MSTPDTPTQDPTPEASGAVDAAHEPSIEPAPVETKPNGETPAAAPGADVDGADGAGSADATGSADGAHGAEQAPSAGASAISPEQAQEKKRRRRKKKKGHGEGAPHREGSAEASGEAAEAGQAPAAEGKPAEKKERKKEKKGPPRERPPVSTGDIVFGKIVEITDEALLIDIPGKARAIFDRREMLLPDDFDERPAAPEPAEAASEGGEQAGLQAEAASAAPAASERPAEASPESEAGPEGVPAPAVEAPREPKVPRVVLEVGADFIGVVHNDGARGGLVVLTHHPTRADKAKPAVEKAFHDKTAVMGLVTGVIKGGVEVDVDGLRAFAPGSHVDLRLGADLSHLVAKRLPFFVTQYAKRGRDVVLSRKSMLEQEAKKARAEALARLKVGEERDGVVRSVVPFGAFVDVGGIEGLVPLQEMSHNRADGPSDVFKAGEPTRVKVIKIDDRGKVWLSRKATIPDPWQQVAQKYAVGTRHQGKVVRIQPFGAFVELEPGIDGLLHTADLSIKRVESPTDVVKVGDPIDVVVSHVDPNSHKIALHPAPTGEAAGEAPQRVQLHKAVKAKVVAIESGGLVVRIMGVTGRNARGYVTAAGSGTPRGTELRKSFTVGQEIEGKVIEIDPRRGEVKLSIKALSEDQERSAFQQYRQQLKAEARFTFGDLLTKKKS